MFKKLWGIIKDFFATVKSIPVVIVTIFSVTIVVMNILATKTIYQNDLIAIDGGILLIWLVVILCDLTTTVKGPKATVCMTVFGVLVNLVASLIFFLINLILKTGNSNPLAEVLSGTIFIIIASTISFICSSTLNAFLNVGIHKLFKKNPDGKLALSVCCEVSTLISQILDNFLFNVLAYVAFAPFVLNGSSWTIVQCVCCALLYGAIDVVIEFILFPIFYKIYKNWKMKESAK